MKKTLLSAFVLLFLFCGMFSQKAYSVDTNNVLLEYCTGTWCGYCPCGHQIIKDNILPLYPKTVIVAYHGTSSDPWYAYSQQMLSAFGFSSYPTGTVGRITSLVSRGSWFSYVGSQSQQAPGVTITITNKLYNEASRQLNATVNFKAAQNLTAGDYRMMVILTEDNLVYPQSHYSACGYNGYINDYVHAHVVKHVVNPPYGDLITDQAWNTGTTITKQVSISVPTHIIYTNANFVVFAYKNGSPLGSSAAVQNASEAAVNTFTLTGVVKSNEVVNDYNLGQNYPNPFNPTTNIRFSIPKDGFTTLKVYDLSGKQVALYLSQFIKAGQYSVDFNGANLSSGVYYYKLESGNFSDVKKMILVK